MYNRFAIEHLNQWLTKSNRKPLVIRGARQVGKTELVRLFCQQADLNLIEINLEEQQISEFEKESSFDIDRALSEIYALTGQQVTDKSLLFIDEIQESNKAYNRLRFFKEQKPNIPLIAAGSLLEVELKKSKQSAPVGRLEFLFLGPMTFAEFLVAHGQQALWEQIKTLDFNQQNTIAETVHQKIIGYLRDYFYVGGMPEAVTAFIEGSRNYDAARSVQNAIMESYRQDVRRYASGKTAKTILDIFDKMAFEVGNKVKFSNFSTEKSTYTREAIDTLDDIYVLQKVYHSNCSGVPIKKGENSNVYKIYLLDVGLYNCLMETPLKNIINISENELLNKGDIAEQFIAQHLYINHFTTTRPRLNYWLRDQIPSNAEVDFSTVIDNKITPIEVKAGKTGSIKSLTRFMYDKKSVTQQAIRYDLAYREQFHENVTFSLKTTEGKGTVTFSLLNKPLYSVEKLA